MKLDKHDLIFLAVGFLALTLIAVSLFPCNIPQVYAGSLLPFLLDPFLETPKPKQRGDKQQYE
jgi:hypothetical protein